MKPLRWAVAISVSVGGIWFALRGVRWADVGAAMERVRFPWLLLFVPLAAGAEYVIREERWRLLLEQSPKQRGLLFPIVAGAFFMNTALPFRAGEAARIFWTHRQTGRPLAGTVAALAVDRLMDSLALVLLFSTALVARPSTTLPRGAVPAVMGMAIAGLIFFVVLARYSQKGGEWIASLPLPVFVRRVLTSFLSGAAPLRSFKTLGAALILSALLWCLIAAIFFGVGRAFGLPLTWPDATLLLAGIALGVALPSTPGFIGTYEAAGVGTLSLLGYDKSVAFPFVASIHLIQITGTALWGVPSLLIMVRQREKKILQDL